MPSRPLPDNSLAHLLARFGLGILVIAAMTADPALAETRLTHSERLALYGQLRSQVAEQQWDLALETVDQMLRLDPGQEATLRPYRQQLEQLRDHPPLPDLPDPAQPSPLRVIRATAAVASVRSQRSSRRINASDPREPLVLIQLPDGLSGRLVTIPTIQEYPAQYEVKVLFSAPVGQPSQALTTVTLLGGGESSIRRSVQAGGAVVLQEEGFIFAAEEVSRPQQVRIEIENGDSYTFNLTLPSRETLIQERDA